MDSTSSCLPTSWRSCTLLYYASCHIPLPVLAHHLGSSRATPLTSLTSLRAVNDHLFSCCQHRGALPPLQTLTTYRTASLHRTLLHRFTFHAFYFIYTVRLRYEIYAHGFRSTPRVGRYAHGWDPWLPLHGLVNALHFRETFARQNLIRAVHTRTSTCVFAPS